MTLAHAIHDAEGWRLLVSRGALLDTEPLPINESSLIVQVDRPVKEHVRDLIQQGFSHHVIAVNGDATARLACLARQTGMEVCRL